ncbi:DNA glycosylase AlkZ-like family protein [Nocardia goodfellowii]
MPSLQTNDHPGPATTELPPTDSSRAANRRRLRQHPALTRGPHPGDHRRVRRTGIPQPAPRPQILLVDGFTVGGWVINRDNGYATLTIRPYDRPFTRQDAADVTAEAHELLAFTDPGAQTRDVIFGEPRQRG